MPVAPPEMSATLPSSLPAMCPGLQEFAVVLLQKPR
jgi:hypothetical protein